MLQRLHRRIEGLEPLSGTATFRAVLVASLLIPLALLIGHTADAQGYEYQLTSGLAWLSVISLMGLFYVAAGFAHYGPNKVVVGAGYAAVFGLLLSALGMLYVA